MEAFGVGACSPLVNPAAFGAGDCGPMVFSFTIRKADETDLGLNVTHHERDRVLCVESVRADGAVDAWNRQCLGGVLPEKAVLPGDMIISVNNVAYDPERMLEECKERRLLRLTISRGGLPPGELPLQAGTGAAATTPAGAGTPASGTSLRADAPEFAPRAAATPTAPAAAAMAASKALAAPGAEAAAGPAAAA
uniref:PDZ domain-containing protein n=1 Tax=Pyrodinium bahamense TaxID=73915 RepID=A0A7S0AMZ5_9DINO|mmetsp:Transcript_38233/g.106558  ORF Transcript_38233/g.106558 Transcript_38233/m.106558 type:complete len:194 (+) Transcript_38233:1-582(+)